MLRTIFNEISGYFEDKVDIVKLSIIERMSLVMSFTMFMMIIMFMMVAVVIFIGMGLGLYIGDLLNSPTGGYFAIAGISILFLFIFFLLKKPLLKIFAGMFIDLLTENAPEKEGENN